MEFWRIGMTLEDVNKMAILKAFQFFQGNKTKTAAALDIAIRTLDAKLAIYLPKSEVSDDGRFERREGPGTRGANGQVRDEVAGRLRMESNAQVSKEQSMPMREPKEVQEMLSIDDAKGNPKRRNIQKGVA